MLAVKVSRFITHIKKQKVDKEVISNFFRSAGKLKEKLGPVLFLLSPKWRKKYGATGKFFENAAEKNRYTIEFTNTSWYDGEVYAILKKCNVAFCIYELEYHLSPMQVTADFVYVRLHGPGKKYQGSYTNASLKKMGCTMPAMEKRGKRRICLF